MKKNTQFLEDRFGMFIHFGAYAVPARDGAEWIRSVEEITNEEYQTYIDRFDPTEYDPKSWAKLAKKAGMKYAVMTTKHHDGFCLFDSKHTKYSTQHTIGKDLIRQFADAFRAEGIKIGFYYSLLDWHHPDYPGYGDAFAPTRYMEEYKEAEQKKDFNRYLSYMHDQIQELLTNYGQIDILWLDFSYDNSAHSKMKQMVGDTWKARELLEMVHELQPGCIVNNRLSNNQTLGESEYAGDFTSPEQMIPPNGMINEDGESLPWESCVTLNDHWGYCANDKNYKTPETIIRTLIECVSKNGNLLLNVGPDAKGRIPKETVQILTEVSNWMEDNADSIYGCQRANFPKPEWGYYTQKGNKLYAHVLERRVGPTPLLGLVDQIEYATLLSDHSEVMIQKPWNAGKFPDVEFFNFPDAHLPNKIATVVELTLKNNIK